MLEALPAVLDGLTSWEAVNGRHGAGWMLALAERGAGDGLKMTRNLTSACTRPATRQLLSFSIGPAGA